MLKKPYPVLNARDSRRACPAGWPCEHMLSYIRIECFCHEFSIHHTGKVLICTSCVPFPPPGGPPVNETLSVPPILPSHLKPTAGVLAGSQPLLPAMGDRVPRRWSCLGEASEIIGEAGKYLVRRRRWKEQENFPVPINPVS